MMHCTIINTDLFLAIEVTFSLYILIIYYTLLYLKGHRNQLLHCKNNIVKITRYFSILGAHYVEKILELLAE